MRNQVLDSMDLEQERGITIKAQSVSLNFQSKDGNDYLLNFIDTPGHVDFSYEVSRSLSACEGCLLVVDAAQGVQAQTLANCYSAIENDLEILPVLNKIDLSQANPEKVQTEIQEVIGIDTSDILKVSAKSGYGIEALLEKIIEKIPAPTGDDAKPLKALIIDSWFDNYVGVVVLVRVFDGFLTHKQKIKFISTGQSHTVESVGRYTPKKKEIQKLSAGEVGYLITGIKEIDSARVGDTIILDSDSTTKPIKGFKQIQPRVFSGLFPTDSNDFEDLRESLAKLKLNDSSLFYEPEVSDALGFGFRCGFLGMLHMEIVQERLEREYDLDLVITAPTVNYELLLNSGELLIINKPSDLPDTQKIRELREPIVEVNILAPDTYVGGIITLCIKARGVQKQMVYTTFKQVNMLFELPLSEVVMNFFDRLKSISQGYASMDYHFLRYQTSNLIKLDVLINSQKVDSLSLIVHKDDAIRKGRDLCVRMKELIPRQMFDVAIQSAIGGKILSRTSVKAMRKNVTAKCYGGDVSRKRKLLDKQKAGKKRMKSIGNVAIPQSAFVAVLDINE